MKASHVAPRSNISKQSAVSTPVVAQPATVKPNIDSVDQRPIKKDRPGQVVVAPVIVDPAGATPVGAIEKEVLTALIGGYDNVAKTAVDLKDMLTRSRMVQEAKDRLDVQVNVLEALAGGKPGVDAKANEIRHLMTVALLDERGSKKLELELAVLGNISKDLAPLEKRIAAIDDLSMRAMMSPDQSAAMQAERRALKAFVHGGAQIVYETKTTEEQLAAGASPAMKDTLTLELSALIGVKGGLTGTRERIAEVKQLGYAAVTRELKTLEALENDLSSIERRANALG